MSHDPSVVSGSIWPTYAVAVHQLECQIVPRHAVGVYLIFGHAALLL